MLGGVAVFEAGGSAGGEGVSKGIPKQDAIALRIVVENRVRMVVNQTGHNRLLSDWRGPADDHPADLFGFLNLTTQLLQFGLSIFIGHLRRLKRLAANPSDPMSG